MILNVSKLNKFIGSKELFHDLNFVINENEKVALIGKNGTGKTTLFRILDGEEKEYQGIVEYRTGLKIILTRQEHFLDESISAIDYILKDLPEYPDLKEILNKYELHGEDSGVSLEEYCDAVNAFGEKGYYDIESEILISLLEFQIPEDRARSPMKGLSGGEKRFVEIVRIMYSECDLALLDEPTNHMDYVGKEKFIKWLKQTKDNLFIVSHDRDVLQHVDKILELKDKQIIVFPGNYDAYLKQNSMNTTSGIRSYEDTLKQIQILEKKIEEHKKDMSHHMKLMREKFERERDRLKEQLKKPSFWIDKNSLEQMSDTVVESYSKYKDATIRIKDHSSRSHKKLLFKIEKLSLGYMEPLFQNVNFDVYSEDKIQIKGRNGAGKSTLIKAIIASINGGKVESKKFYGDITVKNHVRLGIYQQEVDPNMLEMTLGEAVKTIYYSLDLQYNDQIRGAVLGQYLFDPQHDHQILVKNLSGGQKARLQLIKMMANNPNLLILDEPTNHLDLPSIEELENVLNTFKGGIIYVSHDSYFVNEIGGETVQIGKE